MKTRDEEVPWELFRDLTGKQLPQTNLTRPRQLPSYIEVFWLKSIELRMSHWSGDDIRAQLKLMTGLIVKVRDRLAVDAGLHELSVDRGQWPVLTRNIAPLKMTPDVDFTGFVSFAPTSRFSAPAAHVLERREQVTETDQALAWPGPLGRWSRYLPKRHWRERVVEQVPVKRELKGSCLIRVALNGVGKRTIGA